MRTIALVMFLVFIMMMTAFSLAGKGNHVIPTIALQPAYACTCGERPVSEYIERSSSTFTGKVLDTTAISGSSGYDVEFANVSRVWGVWVNDYPEDGKVTVWTSSLGAGDCGYPFEEGREYLVYTQRDESSNTLKVDLCNGTKPLDQAEADLEILGQGTNPMISWRGVSVPATHSGRVLSVTDFIIPAAFGTGAFAMAWMFIRYRRRSSGGDLAPIFGGIAIGLAFALVSSLAYGDYINLDWWSDSAEARENEHLVCSTISGFWPYHRTEIAGSIGKESDLMIVIGTITNVETKILDFYSADTKFDPLTSTSELVGFVPTGKMIPWRVVTLEVEKYLIDETGNHSKQITFRAPANACVDNRTGELASLPASFDSDPASDPDKSVKFSIGDRSLIEIHRWHSGEYKEEGLDAESTIKLDIDENGFVKPDYRIGIDRPIKIEEIEKEIAAEIERLNK